jgi:hypothetical protein
VATAVVGETGTIPPPDIRWSLMGPATPIHGRRTRIDERGPSGNAGSTSTGPSEVQEFGGGAFQSGIPRRLQTEGPWRLSSRSCATLSTSRPLDRLADVIVLGIDDEKWADRGRRRPEERFGWAPSAGYEEVTVLSRRWSPDGGLVYFHLLLGTPAAARYRKPELLADAIDSSHIRGVG